MSAKGKQSGALDVFDGGGNKVSQQAASDSLQVAVVPVPLSCDQKFYIFYYTPQSSVGHADLFLTYSIFDVQQGAIVAKNVQLGTPAALAAPLDSPSAYRW